MVTRYGMSDRLGPRTFGSSNGAIFLGREIGESRDYSEQAAEEIDAEVHRILQTQYNRAKTLLSENRNKLDALVQFLLDRETLDRQGFEELMEGKVDLNGLPPIPDISSNGKRPAAAQ
jgi:cell division protease FtsH